MAIVLESDPEILDEAGEAAAYNLATVGAGVLLGEFLRLLKAGGCFVGETTVVTDIEPLVVNSATLPIGPDTVHGVMSSSNGLGSTRMMVACGALAAGIAGAEWLRRADRKRKAIDDYFANSDEFDGDPACLEDEDDAWFKELAESRHAVKQRVG